MLHTIESVKLMLHGDRACFVAHIGDGQTMLVAGVLSVQRVNRTLV